MLDELKAIIKSPKLWITMAGVALIPTLYNVIFLSSMWDPYGNTKNLPVAVVNQDKSAKLNGKTISIGKDMEDNLSKNDSLDFHFTTAKRAEKELEKGHYYMVITFPKDLSRKATTLMTEKPERLNITYKT
ncbi:TPA: YhgE/Pip domain-containing protein, partial [Streptococcus agalactiae]